MGGKRKRTDIISFDGDETGSHSVRVHFPKHDQINPGEVIEYRMSKEELAAYLAKRK